MVTIGNNKDNSQDYLRHYNHIVDSFARESESSGVTTVGAKSRVRVGRVDDKIFVEPEKSKKKSPKKKLNYWSIFKDVGDWSLSSKILSALLLLGLLRLVVMNHGVISYFEKKDILHDRLQLVEQLKVENNHILREIKRANEDVRYQKNLAREQLGVISSEEYLILFGPKK